MPDRGIGRGWPVQLRDGPLVLRPLRRRDGRYWNEVRGANATWLAPWEATQPEEIQRPISFAAMVRGFDREARAGRMLPLAIEYERRLVGQVTVSGIVWGSLRSGQIGYWVDRGVAGHGIVPTAVAMTVDHCFSGLGMHRIEVNIRPENVSSLRVVEKLGFRSEGVRQRYLHIDGAWRDHATFALTPEDVPGGLLTRWKRAQRVAALEREAASGGDASSGREAAPAHEIAGDRRPAGPPPIPSPVTRGRHTADGA